MSKRHNVNEDNSNEKGLFINPNNNDNDIDIVDLKYRTSRKVEIIADRLVELMGNAQYRSFYCKVAWKLSEARIWQNYEAAKAGARDGNPGRLFTYLCKRDGV